MYLILKCVNPPFRNSSSSYLQQEINLIKHADGRISDLLNVPPNFCFIYKREMSFGIAQPVGRSVRFFLHKNRRSVPQSLFRIDERGKYLAASVSLVTQETETPVAGLHTLKLYFNKEVLLARTVGSVWISISENSNRLEKLVTFSVSTPSTQIRH